MKSKYGNLRIAITSVTIIFSFVLVGTVGVGFKAVNDARFLAKDIRDGKPAYDISMSTMNFQRDMNLILHASSFPIIRNVLDIFQLNFYPVKSEILKLIEVIPSFAGSHTPKKYLVAFQNSAEARGTGGILGAFAVIKIDKGKISVVRTGSNAALTSLDTIPLSMPKEFTNLYRDDPAIWQNSNISPHFPYGARIWLALWEKQFGEHLDGVVAIDPIALSYVLKATGPIVLDSGEIISSKNVVSETLKNAYKKYEYDNLARKEFLVRIIIKTSLKLTAGKFSKIGIARALIRGVDENRILIYSSDSEAEAVLATSKLGGALAFKSNNEFRTVIINTDASKLDYYLMRYTKVSSEGCGNNSKVRVSFTLRNSLKSAIGLPAYVLTRADKTKPRGLISGQHRFLALIYGPPSSKLLGARRSTQFGSPGGVGVERERALLAVDVELAPGQSEKVSAIFERGQGPITFHSQPLVSRERIEIYDKCK